MKPLWNVKRNIRLPERGPADDGDKSGTFNTPLPNPRLNWVRSQKESMGHASQDIMLSSGILIKAVHNAG